jgi:hypothetical protein
MNSCQLGYLYRRRKSSCEFTERSLEGQQQGCKSLLMAGSAGRGTKETRSKLRTWSLGGDGHLNFESRCKKDGDPREMGKDSTKTRLDPQGSDGRKRWRHCV